MPKTWSGLIVLLRKRLWRRVQPYRYSISIHFLRCIEIFKILCIWVLVKYIEVGHNLNRINRLFFLHALLFSLCHLGCCFFFNSDSTFIQFPFTCPFISIGLNLKIPKLEPSEPLKTEPRTSNLLNHQFAPENRREHL